MGRIQVAFESARRRGRRALIPFIMGGDPTLAATRDLLPALEDAGADLIEVGIPFSDPLADGPVIQAAAARALARGTTPRRVLETIGALRRRLTVPIVVLTYWNPVAQYGRGGVTGQDFALAAAAHGVDGIVIPDLAVEAAGPWRRAARRAGLATIFLAAPTSSGPRLRQVAGASTGFIYYVSVTGTTGPRRRLPPQLTRGVRRLRALTTKPICVGFGISTPAQARAVARMADGVIVGSALVRALEESSSRGGRRRAAGRFLRRLRGVV